VKVVEKLGLRIGCPIEGAADGTRNRRHEHVTLTERLQSDKYSAVRK
jgi:hypothetical protein